MQPLCRTIWGILKELNVKLLMNPVLLLVYTQDIHSSIIHNSQRNGSSMNLYEQMNGQINTVHLYKGILFGSKEYCCTNICFNMDKPEKMLCGKGCTQKATFDMSPLICNAEQVDPKRQKVNQQFLGVLFHWLLIGTRFLLGVTAIFENEIVAVIPQHSEYVVFYLGWFVPFAIVQLYIDMKTTCI